MDPCLACKGVGFKWGPDRYLGGNKETGLYAYASGSKIYCDCPHGRMERIKDQRNEPEMPLPVMPKILVTFIF